MNEWLGVNHGVRTNGTRSVWLRAGNLELCGLGDPAITLPWPWQKPPKGQGGRVEPAGQGSMMLQSRVQRSNQETKIGGFHQEDSILVVVGI